ncbi:MAG: hypothetical protein KVP17_005355 [Porospora cf. gigantea B]|uniref:uncharacterized protein n=1 Tax=Porospora cf. gigantea B TaxID=2853592 RepID=UPI003571F7C7|nr:MAG: hypothetical protein KVP17_005355 [Porospora cf. gigantea B]
MLSLAAADNEFGFLRAANCTGDDFLQVSTTTFTLEGAESLCREDPSCEFLSINPKSTEKEAVLCRGGSWLDGKEDDDWTTAVDITKIQASGFSLEANVSFECGESLEHFQSNESLALIASRCALYSNCQSFSLRFEPGVPRAQVVFCKDEGQAFQPRYGAVRGRRPSHAEPAQSYAVGSGRDPDAGIPDEAANDPAAVVAAQERDEARSIQPHEALESELT